MKRQAEEEHFNVPKAGSGVSQPGADTSHSISHWADIEEKCKDPNFFARLELIYEGEEISLVFRKELAEMLEQMNFPDRERPDYDVCCQSIFQEIIANVESNPMKFGGKKEIERLKATTDLVEKLRSCLNKERLLLQSAMKTVEDVDFKITELQTKLTHEWIQCEFLIQELTTKTKSLLEDTWPNVRGSLQHVQNSYELENVINQPVLKYALQDAFDAFQNAMKHYLVIWNQVEPEIARYRDFQKVNSVILNKIAMPEQSQPEGALTALNDICLKLGPYIQEIFNVIRQWHTAFHDAPPQLKVVNDCYKTMRQHINTFLTRCFCIVRNPHHTIRIIKETKSKDSKKKSDKSLPVSLWIFGGASFIQELETSIGMELVEDSALHADLSSTASPVGDLFPNHFKLKKVNKPTKVTIYTGSADVDIKNFNRPVRDSKSDAMVTDSTYVIVFTAVINFCGERFQIKSTSLPIVFVSQSSQEWHPLGKHMWNSHFSEQGEFVCCCGDVNCIVASQNFALGNCGKVGVACCHVSIANPKNEISRRKVQGKEDVISLHEINSMWMERAHNIAMIAPTNLSNGMMCRFIRSVPRPAAEPPDTLVLLEEFRFVYQNINRYVVNAKQHVAWGELAPILSNYCLIRTGKELSKPQLDYLAHRIFEYPEGTDFLRLEVSQEKFLKGPLKDDKGKVLKDVKSLWNWIHLCVNLVANSVNREWKKGLIYGFISKQRAEILLQSCQPNTFLLRFRESHAEKSQKGDRQGDLGICLSVNDKGDLRTVHGHTAEKKDRSLTQFLRMHKVTLSDKSNHRMLFLYPDTPIHEALLDFQEDTQDSGKVDVYYGGTESSLADDGILAYSPPGSTMSQLSRGESFTGSESTECNSQAYGQLGYNEQSNASVLSPNNQMNPSPVASHHQTVGSPMHNLQMGQAAQFQPNQMPYQLSQEVQLHGHYLNQPTAGETCNMLDAPGNPTMTYIPPSQQLTSLNLGMSVSDGDSPPDDLFGNDELPTFITEGTLMSY